MGSDAKAWKTDSLEGLSKGSRVWYHAEADDYQLGTILELSDPTC
eukprot:CAMPEP_0177787872 /NCGR_PEP_ID=MMETSP0491_2-20121128/21773_1 /TAXON_ID=63592 /ORGANISM="Tetraselmis chuii, Strain PLY429" /LENGTH=44 /DNA_ID= /DNA_START= /DNA_END= /DNA_ORIENTATION=